MRSTSNKSHITEEYGLTNSPKAETAEKYHIHRTSVHESEMMERDTSILGRCIIDNFDTTEKKIALCMGLLNQLIPLRGIFIPNPQLYVDIDLGLNLTIFYLSDPIIRDVLINSRTISHTLPNVTDIDINHLLNKRNHLELRKKITRYRILRDECWRQTFLSTLTDPLYSVTMECIPDTSLLSEFQFTSNELVNILKLTETAINYLDEITSFVNSLTHRAKYVFFAVFRQTRSLNQSWKLARAFDDVPDEAIRYFLSIKNFLSVGEYEMIATKLTFLGISISPHRIVGLSPRTKQYLLEDKSFNTLYFNHQLSYKLDPSQCTDAMLDCWDYLDQLLPSLSKIRREQIYRLLTPYTYEQLQTYLFLCLQHPTPIIALFAEIDKINDFLKIPVHLCAIYFKLGCPPEFFCCADIASSLSNSELREYLEYLNKLRKQSKSLTLDLMKQLVNKGGISAIKLALHLKEESIEKLLLLTAELISFAYECRRFKEAFFEGTVLSDFFTTHAITLERIQAVFNSPPSKYCSDIVLLTIDTDAIPLVRAATSTLRCPITKKRLSTLATPSVVKAWKDNNLSLDTILKVSDELLLRITSPEAPTCFFRFINEVINDQFNKISEEKFSLLVSPETIEAWQAEFLTTHFLRTANRDEISQVLMGWRKARDTGVADDFSPTYNGASYSSRLYQRAPRIQTQANDSKKELSAPQTFSYRPDDFPPIAR